MKDFDEARKAREEADRSFRIGGEDFTYKPAVAPEVILRWNQATTGELGELSEQGWLEIFDETITSILEDGQVEKWQRVRDPNVAHPMNIADLREVLKWLIAEATGRPTGEPSGSFTGGDRTATPSKGESS